MRLMAYILLIIKLLTSQNSLLQTCSIRKRQTDEDAVIALGNFDENIQIKCQSVVSSGNPECLQQVP